MSDATETETLLEDAYQYRQRIADLELLESMHAQALEDLHLHQEELHSQNEELRQAQESLAELGRRYRDLFDYAPVANFVLDQSGAIAEANFASCHLLEENRTALLRRPLRLYIDEVDRAGFDLLLVDPAGPDVVRTLEVRVNGRKGRATPVLLTLVAERINGLNHFRIAAVDTSERRSAEEQRRLAATVFEESGEGVMISDPAGRIQRVNRAFTVVTGYTEAEAVGRKPSILASGRHDAAFYRTMWEQIWRDGCWQGEIWNRRKNGEIYPEWLKINTVLGADGQVMHRVGIFSDISESRRTGHDVDRFAFYDMLTDLPNRTLFTDRLKHTLIRAHRDRDQVALLFLDLDRFKSVNDSLGHQSGDLLLQDVAVRLRQQVRANDTVARLGGDEFTVILADLGDPVSARDSALRVAAKICQQLAQPFLIGGHEIVVGSSVGIALFPEDGQTNSDLIKHADIAMYQAKRQGGGRAVFFSQDMNAHVVRRAALESALRGAMRRDDLTLVYQPIVDAVDGRVVGMEALSRWHGPDGPVSPLEFIPILEELGLGDELARWVLRTACRELAEHGFADAVSPWCSINLSPQQLGRNRIGWIAETLAEFGLAPERIVVEITEDHFRHNAESVAEALAEIRDMGIRVALDDFGSGYSSLARLRHLPIDIVKIDQGFIRGLPHEPRDLAIINTIITMARQLGLEFLAEGVETRQQLDLLTAQGCTLVQGYVFARPMPVGDYPAWYTAFSNAELTGTP